MTPLDFLDEARALMIAARNNEIRCRTIISRAYYAAYHTLLNAAQRAGYVYGVMDKRPPGRHENLIHWAARQSGEPALRLAAHRVRDLKSWRHKADYQLQVAIRYYEAEDCLFAAADIVEELLAA